MTLFLSNTIGARENLSYPNEITIESVEALKSAMNHDMIMGKRDGNSRHANKAWLWSDCLFGDIDGCLSIDDFTKRFFYYEFYLATSKSHQIQKGGKPPVDRFHVFFPIPRTDDAAMYCDALSKLSSIEGFDPSVKDPQRFFFGSPESQVFYNSGNPITYLLSQISGSRYVAPQGNKDTQKPISEMVDGDGRNNELFRRGAGKLAAGKSISAIVDELRLDNKRFKKPLDDHEVASVIDSVVRGLLPKEARKAMAAVPEIKGPEDWLTNILKCGYTEKVLRSMDIPKPRQFVDGLVAEGSTILYAPPKWGKSWLALQLARAVATGAEIFRRETLQSNVIYLAAEDHLAQICERVKLQQGIITDNLYIYSNFLHYMADSSPIDVIDQLVTHHKADFIIIDTFNAFFGFEEGSGNAYQNDAKQIKPIHNLAKRLGIGLLVVHHTRKNRTGGFNDVNGSNAFLGGFDVNIQCTQDRISTQSRILMDTYINIVFNKATLCWEEGNSGNDDPMRRAFEQIIKDELRQGMKPMKALISAVMTAESVNYSAKYTAKRIGEMVNEGFLTTQDGGKKQVYGIKDRPY